MSASIRTVSAAIPTVVCDLESLTEPESEPEVLHITPNPPCTTPAVICDPESVTEPESKPETIPTVVCITPKPKKKDWTHFFATPSPPSPTSNYWKYVTWEEDAAWYDRAGTDDHFYVVRQMKCELFPKG